MKISGIQEKPSLLEQLKAELKAEQQRELEEIKQRVERLEETMALLRKPANDANTD